jgi:LemA protein
MKKSFLIIVIILGIIIAIGGFFISSYNSLVTLDEDVNSALSQIDNQLQRRSDLIPNLVETVKGFASQEKEIFTSVADARSKLAGSTTVGEKANADGELNSALSRLLAIAENYPELKSDANFRQLSDELAGTENRIAVARKDYNDVANNFNKTLKRFPMVLIGSILGFEEAEYFEAQEGADQVPQVNFN